jgi:type IV secretory pathway VirB10-like protein
MSRPESVRLACMALALAAAMASARADDQTPEEVPLNPLAGLDASSLSAFRDKPLFTPSRRRPEPEAAPEPEPVVEAAPAPPPEAPAPNLKLQGVVIGDEGAVAVLQDLDGGGMQRLRLGDMVSGWLVTDIGDVAVRLTLGEREQEYWLFDPQARAAQAPAAEPENE